MTHQSSREIEGKHFTIIKERRIRNAARTLFGRVVL